MWTGSETWLGEWDDGSEMLGYFMGFAEENRGVTVETLNNGALGNKEMACRVGPGWQWSR